MFGCFAFFSLPIESGWPTRPPKRLYVVIHGTFSTNKEGWASPEGYFCQELQRASAQENAKIKSFSWSGKWSHAVRQQEAIRLANDLETKWIPRYQEIIFITHSFGTDIVAKASHILAEKNIRNAISAVYALGTPVHPSIPTSHPDMSVINTFINLFSFGDPIQIRLGHKRTYPRTSGERIANIAITCNGISPTHNGIHSEEVARAIPQLHDAIVTKKRKIGPAQFSFDEPGIINITPTKPPHYQYDPTQEEQLKNDSHHRVIPSYLTVMNLVMREMKKIFMPRIQPLIWWKQPHETA